MDEQPLFDRKEIARTVRFLDIESDEPDRADLAFDFGGRLLRGNLSSRTARRLIKTWALQHQRELAVNWKNAGRGLPLNRIAPLE